MKKEINEPTVEIIGTLKIYESYPEGKYSLVLSTPAMDIELTRGSYMHCSDIQYEITA